MPQPGPEPTGGPDPARSVAPHQPAEPTPGDAPAQPLDRAQIRLAPEEATRLQAVILLGLLLLFPALIARAWPAETPAPLPSCQQRATLTHTGVRCDAPGPPLSPARALWVGLRFDLNTASAQTLALVPGIGPKLAARVVEDRAARGPFSSVAEATRVRGIGPKLAARLARYAEVRAVPR